MINKILIIIILLNGLFLNGCAQLVIGGAASSGLILVQERSAEDAARDIIIKTQIEESLFSNNYDELFSKIKVIVIEGRVLLVGTLKNNEERDKAAEIAWKTKNVKEVANYTSLGKSKFIDYVKDSRISLEFRASILADSFISEVNYISTTEKGVMYIMGIAQDNEELEKVLNHANNTPGVKKVINLIIKKDDPKRK